MGAEVDYHDPYIPRPPKMRKYKLEKSSVPLTAESLKKYDCVVIATDHADYAPELILENSRIIVDTRNLMKNLPTNSDRVTKA
jgi:UDP-N-acetyl-D-glucosamine dehydrogenase